MEKKTAIFNYLKLTNLAISDEEYQIIDIDKKTGEKVYERRTFTPTVKMERLLTILFYKVVNEFLKDHKLPSTTLVIEKNKFGLIKDKAHSLISTFEDVYDSLFINRATVSGSYKYLNFNLEVLYDLIGKDLYSVLETIYKGNLSNFPIREKDLKTITDLVLKGYIEIINEFKLASNIRKADKCFHISYFENKEKEKKNELNL